MSQSLTIARAPKRQIQRRRSVIKAQDVGNTVINNTIHTVGVKKTLIRTRIVGTVIYTGSASDVTMMLTCHIKRNGKAVIDTQTAGEALDLKESKEVILRDLYGGVLNTLIGVQQGTRVEIDTKSQRTLDPGDLLSLDAISSSGTGTFDVFLLVTQWFKLA